MRKILMSKPGEFPAVNQMDYSRGTAIKMFASLIKKSKERQISETAEKQVVVSDLASLEKTGR